VNTQSKTDLAADNLHPLAQIGIELFNSGKYYEAHEPLEAAWMVTPSPERDLYQGILQIGLAYYQISRGNFRGALKMFKRGQKNLAPLGEIMLGIDINQLKEDARVIESELRELGPSRIQEIDPDVFKVLPSKEFNR